MSRISLLIAVVIIGLLLRSCAQMKPPTGGPKDEDPPELIATAPLNFSTHFSSSRIIMEFDEFVQIRNLKAQMVINPTMKERPDVRLKGKKVIIDLKSPLNPETTYVINFGDAIVDLNEGNKASGLQYVFSTGDFLDSLQFIGKVVNAFTEKPEKDVWVMLYSNPVDTMPYTGMPDYLGKTDDKGQFEINFIREGRYMAFALRDENSNFKYNAGEEIAYLDSLITPGFADSTNVPHFMRLFLEEDTTQYIDDRIAKPHGELMILLHQPADSVWATPIEPEQKLLFEHGEVGDTTWVWMTNRADFPDLERTKVVFEATPNLMDTVRWDLRRRKNDEDPVLEIKDNLLFNFNPFSAVRLKFNHPIEQIDTSRIELYRDSIPVEYTLKGTKSKRVFEIHHPWEFDTPYRVFIPDGTFTDIFQLTNDTLDKTVKTREERHFGNVKLDLRFAPGDPIILELVNDRDVVIKRVIPEEPGIIEFNRMNPGSFKMRVIYDLNGNGQWDTGNFLLGTQPEPVVNYPSTVQVRSNWDMELEWNLKKEEEPEPEPEDTLLPEE